MANDDNMIEHRYAIGDAVLIGAANVLGKVSAILIERDRTMYLGRYFHGEPHEHFFEEAEISPAPRQATAPDDLVSSDEPFREETSRCLKFL